MKNLIRLIQFVLSEIAELCSLISLTIMAIGFYTILPILVFFALLAFIFAGNWSWLLGVLIYVLIACAVFLIFKAIPEFLNFILGILLNERGENKKIYKKYEQWFESARNQEYERRRKDQEEYQKQQDREKQYWKEKSEITVSQKEIFIEKHGIKKTDFPNLTELTKYGKRVVFEDTKDYKKYYFQNEEQLIDCEV